MVRLEKIRSNEPRVKLTFPSLGTDVRDKWTGPIHPIS